MAPSEPVQRGRRLSPEARREAILDAARGLFAEREPGTISTADVADAAGVARSLVHHYFGGIDDVFIAVVADRAPALADVRTAGPETPFEERIVLNVAAGLDVIDANRETWLAVVDHGSHATDPRIRGIVEFAVERNVERMLTANSDVIADTPVTRHALRAFSAFSTEAIRAWIVGRAPREQTEALLVAAFDALVRHALPELGPR
jgi:AcrR family transcriptional regulator